MVVAISSTEPPVSESAHTSVLSPMLTYAATNDKAMSTNTMKKPRFTAGIS